MEKFKKGITNLEELIKNMEPVLNKGEYVFTTVTDIGSVPRGLTICEIKEKEGVTVVVSKEEAISLGISFDFIASWITLNVHSSLEAVGLTAAFSTALGDHGISCNVIAGYYHDHIFVAKKDEQQAMDILRKMSVTDSST